MSFVSTIIGTAERVPLPDVIIRAAIHRLCSRTATRLATGNAESDAWFADEMAARAIAEHADEANAQHYEVPAAFFAHVLGPNRKYSSCFAGVGSAIASAALWIAAHRRWFLLATARSCSAYADGSALWHRAPLRRWSGFLSHPQARVRLRSTAANDGSSAITG